MDPKKAKEFLNTAEVAFLLGRTPGGIRNLVYRRRIPFRRTSGRLLFIRSEIDAWVKGSPGIKPEDLID